MRIIRHIKVLTGHQLVVALGTFDGVHRGHQKLISQAKQYAQKKGYELAVIAFDPHPQQVVAPERGLRILTEVSEKSERLKNLGVDYLVLLKFNQVFRGMTYQKFIENYLVRALKAKAVFVGYDHSFGKNRGGTVKELKTFGQKYGFEVQVTPPVLSRFQPIKSSLIRRELSSGNFNWAVDLLGHPYLIGGIVIKGAGRGSKIGFPTINIKVSGEKLLPAHGIFAGWLRLSADNAPSASRLPVAIYIGSRPTFPEKNVTIEAHVLGTAGSKFKPQKSLNGKKVTLELTRYVRSDRQFSDVEDLKKAIAEDVAKCRKILG